MSTTALVALHLEVVKTHIKAGVTHFWSWNKKFNSWDGPQNKFKKMDRNHVVIIN